MSLPCKEAKKAFWASPITPATGKAALWAIREPRRDGTLEPCPTPGGDENRPAAPPSPTDVGEGGVGVGEGQESPKPTESAF